MEELENRKKILKKELKKINNELRKDRRIKEKKLQNIIDCEINKHKILGAKKAQGGGLNAAHTKKLN
tara:strand:+ start:638 stop:838 length:201 start_codon:yes stop_codon:yes gene_type:complete